MADIGDLDARIQECQEAFWAAKDAHDGLLIPLRPHRLGQPIQCAVFTPEEIDAWDVLQAARKQLDDAIAARLAVLDKPD